MCNNLKYLQHGSSCLLEVLGRVELAAIAQIRELRVQLLILRRGLLIVATSTAARSGTAHGTNYTWYRSASEAVTKLAIEAN
jgi:hypothetical protein